MKDTKSHSVMECYKADARIAELETYNAKLRAALEIYARPENWQRYKGDARVIWNWHPYEDGFKIAQAVLSPTPAEPTPDGPPQVFPWKAGDRLRAELEGKK
jgi:hypothetical protein